MSEKQTPNPDALAAEQPQPEAVAWPKVNGTARMFDNARALMVIMEREPTDDEMRAFDDAIKGWGTSPPAAPQPEKQPVAWREHVEQRIRSWRQRTMNRYGDRLAIDDYMSADAIDDLVDYVCDEYAAPPPAAEPSEASANERRLRRLLCAARHRHSAYMDDGEASDCSVHPSIDYLRDSLDEIEAKWRMRASATPAAPTEPGEAQDAARYRWLRDHRGGGHAVVNGELLEGSELDENIDAALRAAAAARTKC